MEDRIKQRLTGAAIVVALLVLLVPEMFRGRPPAAPAAGGAVSGGPPLRSYTIDLKERPETHSAPALDAAQAPAAGAAPVAPAAQDSAVAATPPAPVGTPPATAPPPATVAATPAAGDAAVPAPAPAPAAGGDQAVEAGAARYQVQLGLFASRANAERLAARASRQGVRVMLSGPDARGLYRVHTPTHGSRAEAQAVQQKLRDLGLSAALTSAR
ncbi:MAG: SPOR domain-containing protein [Gammaproteobacteria bacterium]|nr:SPOR domain-containing protein [Gammaproteobacteria bacterium]